MSVLATARAADRRAVVAGRRAAMTLAVIGVGIALTYISAFASLDSDLIVDGARRYGAGFVTASGALFVIAWSGGGPLARTMHRPRLLILLGASFGELAMIAAVLLGAGSSLLCEPRPFTFGLGVALFDGIAKPVYWTVLFGGVPALALGAAFPRTTRHYLGLDLARTKKV